MRVRVSLSTSYRNTQLASKPLPGHLTKQACWLLVVAPATVPLREYLSPACLDQMVLSVIALLTPQKSASQSNNQPNMVISINHQGIC